MMGSYDEAEDYEIDVPPIPPGLATLTGAQQALAELLQLPQELIVAAAKHSAPATPAPNDDFATWMESLAPERREQYLVRLARNEPGLSRALVAELRALRPDQRDAGSASGERVTFATLLTESKDIKEQLERERREEAATPAPAPCAADPRPPGRLLAAYHCGSRAWVGRGL